MKNGMHVEVCCASLEDCLTAQRCGADAIELVCAHLLGGLTPSAGLLAQVKARVTLPVSVMVRPRGAGFCYSQEDFAVMCEDARRFVAQGADGIVFGFLTPEGDLDYERSARFLECTGDAQTVFHRAIDVTGAHQRVARQLVELGVTRVLTSGGAQSAVDGVSVIRELQESWGDQIQILVGGGVRTENAALLAAQTGVTRLHLGGTSMTVDPSTNRNAALDFGARAPEAHDVFPAVDFDTISAVIKSLDQKTSP